MGEKTPCCAWCEKPLPLRRKSGELYRSSYCDRACFQAHRTKTNYGMNKRQVELLAGRPPGPKGCTTVDEWVAKGGVIGRLPAVYRPGEPVTFVRYRNW